MNENSFSHRKLKNQLPLYQEVKLIPLSKKYLLINYFAIGISFLREFKSHSICVCIFNTMVFHDFYFWLKQNFDELCLFNLFLL